MYAFTVAEKTKEAPLIETPGTRIRSAREGRGLSEDQLAVMIGVSKQAILAMELAGATNYPKLPNALKIAKVLGISPWYIAFGEEEPATTQNDAGSERAVLEPEQRPVTLRQFRSVRIAIKRRIQSLQETLDSRLGKIEEALGIETPRSERPSEPDDLDEE